MDKTLEIELTEIRPKVLATALKFFRAQCKGAAGGVEYAVLTEAFISTVIYTDKNCRYLGGDDGSLVCRRLLLDRQ